MSAATKAPATRPLTVADRLPVHGDTLHLYTNGYDLHFWVAGQSNNIARAITPTLETCA